MSVSKVDSYDLTPSYPKLPSYVEVMSNIGGG
jgi:hypothetical protein